MCWNPVVQAATFYLAMDSVRRKFSREDDHFPVGLIFDLMASFPTVPLIFPLLSVRCMRRSANFHRMKSRVANFSLMTLIFWPLPHFLTCGTRRGEA